MSPSTPLRRTLPGTSTLYLLGLDTGNQPGIYVVGDQRVALVAEKPPAPPSFLAHIAFATPNAEGMRRYLQSRGITVPDSVTTEQGGRAGLKSRIPKAIASASSRQPQCRNSSPRQYPRKSSTQDFSCTIVLQKTSFIQILGFKPYWFGGMTEGHTDWVALQVPEGRQWIEYMLVDKGSEVTTPPRRSQSLFARVVDMNAAEALLQQRGWTPAAGSKKQMGKDGKWQLNVYHPDGTRVELMEFTPKERPCCSPFTAPHPAEMQ